MPRSTAALGFAFLLGTAGCGGSAEEVCVGSVHAGGCKDAGQAEASTPTPPPTPTPTCGNGVVDEGERCDVGVEAGGAGACPTDCEDGDPCTRDALLEADTCAASCEYTPVTTCAPADGCCPAGCTSATDDDCDPACGDGVLDDGETCDTAIPPGEPGACPTDCEDGDACTRDELLAAGSCAASCDFVPLTACQDGDGCCPSGCTVAADDDCAGPSEICNGLDDDGDSVIDPGCDDDGDGWCDADLMTVGFPSTCPSGGGDCDDDDETIYPGAPETCDGADENCDGDVDEGNPDGGAPCEPSPVGGCTAVMTCVAGSLQCRGSFVSPLGSPDNPGTRLAPLSTIGGAIANAEMSDTGIDVCVCDPPTRGATVYEESLTLVEGTSVIGRHNCDTWARDTWGVSTRIRNTTLDGVQFPPGLTPGTALDGFAVEPLVLDGQDSTALTVVDSSPSLVDIQVEWPQGLDAVAATGTGLRITGSLAHGAAPRVLGGDIRGSFEATVASIGVDCEGCGGTTLTAQRIASGYAPRSVAVWARGNLTGLTIASPPGSVDGTIEGPWSAADSTAVLLEQCTGAPTVGAGGGLTIRGGIEPERAVGVRVTGPSCAAVIEGDGENGEIIGCSLQLEAQECMGVSCEGGAPCVIRDFDIVGASWLSIPTSSVLATVRGVRCLDGACATIERTRIRAGDASITSNGIGLDVVGSSPFVNANQIVGPEGHGCPVPGCMAVRLDDSNSRLTNNVIQHGQHPGAAVEVSGSVAAEHGPVLHSNAILAACPISGASVGIRLVGGAPGEPLPVIQNNIIGALSTCDSLYGIEETGSGADPSVISHNNIWNTAAGLYLDEGTTPLTGVSEVNALPEAQSNLSCDPVMDVTWHLAAGSCCLDAGTADSSPSVDFDEEPRPSGDGYDIGPDELP